MPLFRPILAAVLLATSALAATVDCGLSCGNYGTTLYNCKSMQDQAVLTIGAAFTSPPQALNCMCKDFVDIQACDYCVFQEGFNLGSGSDPFTSTNLLTAWMGTCYTWNTKGVTPANNCWLGLPSGDTSACYIPPASGGSGSGSGSDSGSGGAGASGSESVAQPSPTGATGTSASASGSTSSSRVSGATTSSSPSSKSVAAPVTKPGTTLYLAALHCLSLLVFAVLGLGL